jgi:hypothetical protein
VPKHRWPSTHARAKSPPREPKPEAERRVVGAPSGMESKKDQSRAWSDEALAERRSFYRRHVAGLVDSAVTPQRLTPGPDGH